MRRRVVSWCLRVRVAGMGLHVTGVRLRGWFYSVEDSILIDQSIPFIFSVVWSDTGTVGVVLVTGFAVWLSAALAKRQV